MSAKQSVVIMISGLAMTLAFMWILGYTANEPARAYANMIVTPTPTPGSTGIRNGDFENGPDGSWVEYSYQGRPLIMHRDDLPATPHSGNRAVWLGGDDNEIAYISQSVTIPPEVSTLRFWHWVDSEDICGYDFARVRINNTTLLTTNLCEQNNTEGWIEKTIDIGAFAGETVSLQFRAETNDSLNSNYFVDDVTLQGSTPGEHYVYLPLILKNFWAGYRDSFSNPNSGWSTGENENVIRRYLNGEYQIYIKREDHGWAVTPDLVLPSDYRIEVDARKVSSGACSYGLVFGARWTPDSWETYQVLVWPTTGEFFVNKRTLDGSWTTIQDWTYSAAINQDYGTNRIRVDRIGTKIKIYMNGTLAANITDSTFTGPGRDAGIRAYSYGDAPVDVRFDNFAASQP